MIYILLCDDNEIILNKIKKYIISISYDLKYDIDIETYTSAEDVLKRIHSTAESSDILITDINMPCLSGMDMVQILRDEGLDIILIFMTAYEEYVFKSFEYSPFRYIRKEYMEIELLPALQAACEKVNANRNISILVKTPDGMQVVRTRDILYYELENRKCIIYTIQNKQYETWKKISEFREEMGEMDSSFLQIYRGCMVNKYYVKAVKKDVIVLEDGTELPMSRRKKHEITDIMMEYWRKII
ncbi:MAG: response regulator transcription factor [Lachnospiraceae bacterium]|nr:response regulator transcription factor [Lachnospiraceae bacterium]